MEFENVRKHRMNAGGVLVRVLLVYWGTMVIWQNIQGEISRSGIDLLIKVGLLGMLSAFYLLQAKTVSRNLLMVLLFAGSMIITFGLSNDALSGHSLIVYSFPILLSFFIFGIGHDIKINQKDLLFFLNGIILIVLYSAIYAIFFCREQFEIGLSLQRVYGNELLSFFLTNHEYAMYLLYAILACILCLEIKRDEPFKNKWFYWVEIFIFIPNLILTFSRTTLLTLAIVVVMYALFSQRAKMKKWMIVSVLTAVLGVALSSGVRVVLSLMMNKGDAVDITGGREVLYRYAIELFSEGTWLQKLFGQGLSVSRTFKIVTTHSSVHNAYLQTLLIFGACGLLFLLGVLVSQLIESIKLYKKSKFFSVVFSILLLSGMVIMFTNTAIVFRSGIDSFFLTVITIVIPMYVRNAIVSDEFET